MVTSGAVQALPRELAPDPVDGRSHLLVWLGAGAREVHRALCSVPRSRWALSPPSGLAESLGKWSALRHVRHLALYDARLTVPSVRAALGDLDPNEVPASVEIESQDVGWVAEAAEPGESLSLIRTIAEARFDLLQYLESAPDSVWERPLPQSLRPARQSDDTQVGLAWLVARSYQHELEHLSALWKLALHWDSLAPTPGASSRFPLHPADRMETH